MATETLTTPEAGSEGGPRSAESFDVMISKILNKDVEELNALMLGGEELEDLAQNIAESLIQRRDEFQEIFPWFDWDNDVDHELRNNIQAYFESQIDQHVAYLQEKANVLAEKTERLAAIEQDPEKKSLWRSAVDKVKGFAGRHKFLTAAAVLVLGIAAVGTGFYLAGEWELFATTTGLDHLFEYFSGTAELNPPTPDTPLPPEGGVLEVPPGAPPPPSAPSAPPRIVT